jgi:hypothetical protein
MHAQWWRLPGTAEGVVASTPAHGDRKQTT